jgi:hypothetical protein
MPSTPRYKIPYGDPNLAMMHLDTLIMGGWSPRLDGIVASTRTFAYHGGYATGGFVVDGTIVISDNSTEFVQRTAAGVVTADTTLDATLIPMAVVTTVSGHITNFEDIRDLFFSMAAGGGGGSSSSDAAEEPPGTASPYDDEFVGTALSSLWTTVGGPGTIVVKNSRLLQRTVETHYKQSMSLTHPLRIRASFGGSNLTGVYDGPLLWLGGSAYGIVAGFQGTGSISSRRYIANKCDAGGTYVSGIGYENFDGSDAYGNVQGLEIIMMVDATNIVVYAGSIGSPYLKTTYARSNVGTLNRMGFCLGPGSWIKYFRVDRATYAFDFPLDWAG